MLLVPGGTTTLVLGPGGETNDGDTCKVSSPSGAAALAKRIGANAELIHLSSTEIAGPPCEAFAPHGFYGVENDAIAKIATWIRLDESSIATATQR